MDTIKANLNRNLDPSFNPTENVIQELLLDAKSFEEAVQVIQHAKLTSPCYVILGGLKDNEGVVITRDFDQTVHTHWLSEEDWYVVQTNKDVFRVDDRRYLRAVELMDQYGQDIVELDGL